MKASDGSQADRPESRVGVSVLSRPPCMESQRGHGGRSRRRLTKSRWMKSEDQDGPRAREREDLMRQASKALDEGLDAFPRALGRACHSPCWWVAAACGAAVCPSAQPCARCLALAPASSVRPSCRGSHPAPAPARQPPTKRGSASLPRFLHARTSSPYLWEVSRRRLCFAKESKRRAAGVVARCA